jgi:hypothetical protein
MCELDAAGFGSDGVCEHPKVIRGGLMGFVPQAWVLAHEGMASEDGVVLYAAFAHSKNLLRRLSNASCLSWVSI